MFKTRIFVSAVIVAAAALAVWLMHPPKVKAPTVTTTTNTNSAAVTTGTIQFSTADLPDRDPAFDFRVVIPDTWAAQYLAGPKAIVFYIPTAGVTSLTAVEAVITLGTDLPTGMVKTSTVDGQTVTWFKRSIDSPATGLPSWLSTDHREAWVAIKGQTKMYYVMAQAPTLDDTVFDRVVASVNFNPALPSAPLVQ